MESKKVLVLFPGKRYSCELPLLYLAGCVYRDAGYDVIPLVYPELEFQGHPGKEVYEAVMKSVLAQVRKAKINSYSEAVFISKSMGTVTAGELEGKVKIPVRQIYLTPLEETLPYMKGKKNITAVVQGTADKWFDPKALQKFCAQEGLRLVRFRDVGHRLEAPDDIQRTLKIFAKTAALYQEDASGKS